MDQKGGERADAVKIPFTEQTISQRNSLYTAFNPENQRLTIEHPCPNNG